MKESNSLSNFLQKRWYGSPGVLLALSPLEALFKYTSQKRKQHQATQAKSVGLPLIVVGNINVGGTGKTPTIIALTKFLMAKGLRVGVISRGYGRESKGLQIADEHSNAAQLGDEPYEIFRNTQCRLAVANVRIDAAQALASENSCDILLSDDGLQHYRLFRDKEIILIDGKRLFGNGHLLPVGPLRENYSRCYQADWVLKNITDCEAPAEDIANSTQDLRIAAQIHVVAERVVHLRTGKHFPLDKLKELKSVLAVAGLSNPHKFFDTLSKLDVEFEKRSFPDHHRYTGKDLEHTGDILMTEKDAVKCADVAGDNAYFLQVSMQLTDPFLNDFWEEVQILIEHYKQNDN